MTLMNSDKVVLEKIINFLSEIVGVKLRKTEEDEDNAEVWSAESEDEEIYVFFSLRESMKLPAIFGELDVRGKNGCSFSHKLCNPDISSMKKWILENL